MDGFEDRRRWSRSGLVIFFFWQMSENLMANDGKLEAGDGAGRCHWPTEIGGE